MLSRSRVLSIVLVTLTASGLHGSSAEDWPRFRGPNADGASPEKGLFRRAGDFGLDLAWKQALGSGYSGIAIAEGRVVTMFSDGESDVMAAFDPQGGSEGWRFTIGPTYTGHDGSHDGPIGTPLIDSGRVFGLGPRGLLFALDLETGKKLWSSDLVAERQSQPPFYGFSSSPILQDGVLIVQIGGKEASIAGYDPATGDLLWATGTDAVMHQSPIPFRFDGVGQVVAAGNTKLVGLEAETGKVLWEYAHEGSGPRGIWSMMPVDAGRGRLFLAHQDEASAMVQLERTDRGPAVKKLWEGRSIKNSYNIPVYHDGYLYAFSTRFLTCVDAATGEPVWRSREPGDGFIVLADGHLVIATKKGGLHVVEATPEGYHEVAGMPLFDDLAWTEPSIAGGSVYVRSLSDLVRVDVRRGEARAGAAGGGPGPGTIFPAFVAKVEAASGAGKEALIDEFLAAQAAFPITEDDGIAHFVYRGEGSDLAVAGEMIGARQEQAMTRVPGTDLFYHSMRLEADARANYLFMRDYEPILDPRNPRTTVTAMVNQEMEVSFIPELSEMSWLAMPDWKAPGFLDEPDPSRRGRIDSHTLQSETMDVEHEVHVYLPAGYDDGDRVYPVAYVHGGPGAIERGLLPRALDNLTGKSVEPTILVLIGSEPPAFAPPTPYVQMVLGELIPFIDSTYRTIPEAASRASLGNGGLAFPAFLCALVQPGVFGKVGVQSGIWFDFALAALQPMLKTADEQPLDLYLDWGKYDLRSPDERWDMGQRSRDFAKLLREKGYAPAGGEVHDGTGWASWSNRTDAVFGALFPAGR